MSKAPSAQGGRAVYKGALDAGVNLRGPGSYWALFQTPTSGIRNAWRFATLPLSPIT